uniref:Uncharacterized protein n=1 Tax=Anguilla anguilla TaxID=7936 RepID=A0A0E9PKZ3_ANGAN
MYTEGPLIDHL